MWLELQVLTWANPPIPGCHMFQQAADQLRAFQSKQLPRHSPHTPWDQQSQDKPLPSMKTTKVELNLLVDSFSSRSNVLFPSISSSEMPSSS